MESTAEQRHFAPEGSEGLCLGRPGEVQLEGRVWQQAEWVSL